MVTRCRYIDRIPILRHVYRKNYFAWKRTYINFLRDTGIRPGPVIVNWVATNRCNSNCVYCEAKANVSDNEELTTEEIKKVLDELGELKVKRFFVIGGEPMMRKDLFEVLDYAKQHSMKIGIFTNSLLLERFQEEIRLAGLENIWTSIDGLPKTHNKYRGYPDAFETTMNAIHYYFDINIPIRVVNTVVHNDNINELPELFEYLKNAKMNWWRLCAVLPVGRARGSEISLSDENIIQLFEYVEQFRKQTKVTISEEMGYLGCWESRVKEWPFFCHSGLTFCAIMPDGNVAPCQVDDKVKYSEGNVKIKPFKDIWKQGFKSFRKVELEGECLTCCHQKACSGGCWIRRVNNLKCTVSLFNH